MKDYTSTSLRKRISTRLIIVLVLMVLFLGAVIGIYSINVTGDVSGQRVVPLFILRSSESDVLSNGSVNALAVANNTILLSQQDTQSLKAIDASGKDVTPRASLPSARALSATSDGNLFVAGDKEITIFDPKGYRINSFSISKPATSIAALDKDSLVVANADTDGLMTIFEASGKTSRKIGKLKILDKLNEAQNRFLNSGKVAVGQSGEIYYVSMHSLNPIVQKFSRNGELSNEFDIEGAAVEFQVKLAKDFLNSKKEMCTGGYSIVRSISVDKSTGHLWVGVNGLSEPGVIRSESGTLYEYNSSGDKLAEYALEIPSTNGKRSILTDVKDVVLSSSIAYVLTSGGKVYRFDVNQRSEVTPKETNTNRNLFVSLFQIGWGAIFPTTVLADEELCAAPLTYSCDATCASGVTPTTIDCAAELKTRMASGDIIVERSCSANSTGGTNSTGGCSGSMNLCNTGTGVQVTESLSLSCNPVPTPVPSPSATPDASPTPECVDPPLYPDGCNSGYNWSICLGYCVDGAGNHDPSPIIVDVNGNGFAMTNSADGVNFDLNSDGVKERLSWTAAGSDDAWLVLDRNGNGSIDNGTELFGNYTPQPRPPIGEIKNGFLALAEYDKSTNGGNEDGEITNLDSVFTSLRLWQDVNHNGISEPNELHTLPELGLASISRI